VLLAEHRPSHLATDWKVRAPQRSGTADEESPAPGITFAAVSPKAWRRSWRAAMATYGQKASDKVEKTMHERKQGTLTSGSGKKVTSRKQAIAIGLSEAREEGAKVPAKKSGAARRKVQGGSE
jgi:hypothetical protein